MVGKTQERIRGIEARLLPEDRELLERLSAEMGLTLSAVIVTALREFEQRRNINRVMNGLPQAQWDYLAQLGEERE